PAVLDELVLNGLSLVQSAKSGAFDRRDVHKHILPAFLGLDEAIALRRIEPLYGALRHARSPKYYQRASVPQSASAEQGPPGLQSRTFWDIFVCVDCQIPVPGEGFEPPTNGLQNRCSTPELTRLSEGRLALHMAVVNRCFAARFLSH